MSHSHSDEIQTHPYAIADEDESASSYDVIEVENIVPTPCDCKENISLEDAVDVVIANDDWATYVDADSVDSHTISTMITFQNSNELAHLLSTGSNPEVATALLDELLYYRSHNQI